MCLTLGLLFLRDQQRKDRAQNQALQAQNQALQAQNQAQQAQMQQAQQLNTPLPAGVQYQPQPLAEDQYKQQPPATIAQTAPGQ
jgi:hypothetical protein